MWGKPATGAASQQLERCAHAQNAHKTAASGGHECSSPQKRSPQKRIARSIARDRTHFGEGGTKPRRVGTQSKTKRQYMPDFCLIPHLRAKLKADFVVRRASRAPRRRTTECYKITSNTDSTRFLTTCREAHLSFNPLLSVTCIYNAYMNRSTPIFCILV